MQSYQNALASNTTGLPISGATVEFKYYPSGTSAVIYSSNSLTATMTNPVTTGSDGSFYAFLKNGWYTISISTGGGTPVVSQPFFMFDPTDTDGSITNTWAVPGAIGSTTPNSGNFSSITATSATFSTLSVTSFPLLTMTGPINDARTTFNTNTATPDIWTSQGNVIAFTDTTTITGFAAAPQAGARRILDCAGATVFTASANMLIDGVASGSNLTVAAGDRVEVYARTTTQFVLRHIAFATTSTDPTYSSTNDAAIPSVSWVRNAMSAIATAAGFATSFAANGYIKFPSWLGGFVVQWGSAFANGTTVVNVTYPIAFPYGALQVVGVIKNQQGATLNMSASGTTQFSMSISVAGTPSVGWIAVGY